MAAAITTIIGVRAVTRRAIIAAGIIISIIPVRAITSTTGAVTVIAGMTVSAAIGKAVVKQGAETMAAVGAKVRDNDQTAIVRAGADGRNAKAMRPLRPAGPPSFGRSPAPVAATRANGGRALSGAAISAMVKGRARMAVGAGATDAGIDRRSCASR